MNAPQTQARPKQYDSRWFLIAAQFAIPLVVLAYGAVSTGVMGRGFAGAAVSGTFELLSLMLFTRLINRAKPWFVENVSLYEFYFLVALNQSLLALAVLKIFELCTG
ncbi:hypothetical protein F6X40_10860 [Paraburkholderia sp. UCT31]|uniref:hypothetical protein n=1 Tax=Paraburkholderia sp. UCT31 TaxID=2615209 RepID=UPI001655A9C8|nr:hypothetical protein [Paraburkholderia sp. UCT31]MBC8737307.1 hypothetical protein [Paraburkholderia sp. UCT31]